jgi:hypothetical protein
MFDDGFILLGSPFVFGCTFFTRLCIRLHSSSGMSSKKPNDWDDARPYELDDRDDVVIVAAAMSADVVERATLPDGLLPGMQKLTLCPVLLAMNAPRTKQARYPTNDVAADRDDLDGLEVSSFIC